MNNDLHAETERLLREYDTKPITLYRLHLNSFGHDLASQVRTLDAKVREQEEHIARIEASDKLRFDMLMERGQRISELEAKLAEKEKEMMCPRCKSSYDHTNHCTHCGETW